MKKSFILFVIAVISTAGLFSSCRKCQGAVDINYSGAIIDFIDSATGKFIYTQTNSLYQKDNLRILDEAGNSVPIKSILSLNDYHWQLEIAFYNPQLDPLPFGGLCKKFTIQYSPVETDTLTMCFRAAKSDCGTVFATVEAAQHGQPSVRVATNVNRFWMKVKKR